MLVIEFMNHLNVVLKGRAQQPKRWSEDVNVNVRTHFQEVVALGHMSQTNKHLLVKPLYWKTDLKFWHGQSVLKIQRVKI